MQAGELLRDCALCPELVVVPTGEFLMGSSNEDIESGIAGTNEAPQRRVALKHPLAVGRHEVTRDQFAAFISATGHPDGGKCWTLENNTPQERHDRSFRDPGYRQTDSDPVVCVSWNDAKAYVAWLSKSTGKTYRLLAEAEWEYIARAGATTRYHFGNNETELCEFANGADRSAREAGLPDTWDYLRCNDGHVYTSPVGSFRPNAFGIFDVIGNVWEWTEDCYAESLAETPLDGPTRSDRDCQFHSARGGSWSGTARMLRAAVRGKASQDNRYDDIGFRVARTLMP